MEIPEGILCARSHEWVLEQGGLAIVGLCDWRVNSLGDIVVVELPEVSSEIGKDEVFATVESVREATEMYAPVSGTIVEVNEDLINSPELINEDPFSAWFVKIAPTDFTSDTEGLIEYSDYIDEVS